MKVYGSPVSTASQRVFATLYEKGIDFEFALVDMGAGDHKKEPYLSFNPFGQVPALEDGDLKLFESRAITQYIAHECSDKGTQLVCPGSKNMAYLAVWIEVEGHQFDPVASKLAWELVYKPLFGLTTDSAVVEENGQKLEKILDIYEKRLSESKYLACDCFTLADLHHTPVIQYLLGTQAKKLFDARPHVSAWVADITARPAWAKVLEMKNKQ